MQFSRKGLIFILLLLLLVPAGLCHGGATDSYRHARRQYDTLLASQKKQLYRDNWEKVIGQFDTFSRSYPDHSKAPAAIYLAGKASQRLYNISRKRDDAVAAVAFYKRLADEHSASNLADDGLVLAAGILERQLNRPAESCLLYQRTVSRYSGGDMASLARQGASRLAAYASEATKPAPRPKAISRPAKAPDNLQLTGIRHWPSPDYTRIVLELNGPVAFRTGSLPGEAEKGVLPRIYIDLKGAGLGESIEPRSALGEGNVRRIRTGKQPGNSVRVVLDLDSDSRYKAFALKDPDRIVIDIGATQQAVLKANDPELRALPTAKNDVIAKVLEQAPEEPQPQINLPQGASNRLRRIVVDAGHGGKDPGAIGSRGTLEKDVTLALAKVLAKRLKREFGCQVILTRDKDVFLALEERTALANRLGADLFISIHANASANRSVQGVETYYLNFSKNDKAAAVAARENGTSLKQVSDLEMILFDLMANSKINESSRLAAEIQNSLVNNLNRHYSQVKDHGVRQGPFYVLLGATMPSVLVETAFISNKTEEKRLASSKYQQRAADAIVAGVKKFAKASRMIATK